MPVAVSHAPKDSSVAYCHTSPEVADTDNVPPTLISNGVVKFGKPDDAEGACQADDTVFCKSTRAGSMRAGDAVLHESPDGLYMVWLYIYIYI